jgi:hypothetical protein
MSRRRQQRHNGLHRCQHWVACPCRLSGLSGQLGQKSDGIHHVIEHTRTLGSVHHCCVEAEPHIRLQSIGVIYQKDASKIQ